MNSGNDDDNINMNNNMNTTVNSNMNNTVNSNMNSSSFRVKYPMLFNNLPLIIIILVLIVFNIMLFSYYKLTYNNQSRTAKIVESNRCSTNNIRSTKMEIPKKSIQSIMSNDVPDYTDRKRNDVSLVSLKDFHSDINSHAKRPKYTDPTISRFLSIQDGYSNNM